MYTTTFQSTIGNPFIELASIESSNNYAMEQVQNGYKQDGTVWFAHEQYGGKGQRNKQWKSQKNTNITMSALINTSAIGISRQFYLSAAVAVACHAFFNAYAGNKTNVKWPNDIYWNDRKAAGILIENVISGQNWQWAVVGIGMNLNQETFDAELTNAVSLKQITGAHYDTVSMAKQLCQYLTEWIGRIGGKDENLIIERYNEVLYQKNNSVKLKKGNIGFEATVLRVDEMGRLWVNNGIETAYSFGEVEWMIANG